MDLYYHEHNPDISQQLEPAVLIYLLFCFKDVLCKIYNLFFRFVINIVLILIAFDSLIFIPVTIILSRRLPISTETASLHLPPQYSLLKGLILQTKFYMNKSVPELYDSCNNSNVPGGYCKQNSTLAKGLL